MTTDAALVLHQWLSPAFPVGAFAYSHGLEAAVNLGQVQNGDGLAIWLQDILRYGAGQSDPLFIAAAYNLTDPDMLADLDATALAFQAAAERQLETTQQGAAFARTIAEVWGHDIAASCYPVVLGCAAKAQGLPLGLTLRLYLQAFVSNIIAAGQRLLPVGQTQGQRILTALSPDIEEAAAQGETGDLARLSTLSFLGDVAAMAHETQYSRIFRS